MEQLLREFFHFRVCNPAWWSRAVHFPAAASQRGIVLVSNAIAQAKIRSKWNIWRLATDILRMWYRKIWLSLMCSGWAFSDLINETADQLQYLELKNQRRVHRDFPVFLIRCFQTEIDNFAHSGTLSWYQINAYTQQVRSSDRKYPTGKVSVRGGQWGISWFHNWSLVKQFLYSALKCAFLAFLQILQIEFFNMKQYIPASSAQDQITHLRVHIFTWKDWHWYVHSWM